MEYLTSIAESHGARYIILYRGNINFHPHYIRVALRAGLNLAPSKEA